MGTGEGTIEADGNWRGHSLAVESCHTVNTDESRTGKRLSVGLMGPNRCFPFSCFRQQSSPESIFQPFDSSDVQYLCEFVPELHLPHRL